MKSGAAGICLGAAVRCRMELVRGFRIGLVRGLQVRSDKKVIYKIYKSSNLNFLSKLGQIESYFMVEGVCYEI